MSVLIPTPCEFSQAAKLALNVLQIQQREIVRAARLFTDVFQGWQREFARTTFHDEMAPGTEMGDLARLLCAEAPEQERLAAAYRMVERMGSGVRGPRAKRALQEEARRQGRPQKEVLQELLAEGLFLAVGEREPRQIRWGAQWVRRLSEEQLTLLDKAKKALKDPEPTEEELVVLDNALGDFLKLPIPEISPRLLALPAYMRFLFAEAHKATVSKLLDQHFPGGPRDVTTPAWFFDGLPAPEELQPEEIFMRREEREEIILNMKSRLKPRYHAIPELYLNGYRPEEIACELEIDRATVYRIMKRLTP